jgi:integrase
MAQHNDVSAPVRHYTRADFTALRFRLNKVPSSHIFNNVYHEDGLLEKGIETPAQMEAWLDEMRDHLVERLCLSNPLLSKQLADARTFNRWSKTAIDYLVNAADQNFTKPSPSDSISAWLRPVAYKVLRGESLLTLAQLKAYIEVRGPGWYRPIPRLGVGKARAIERWLVANAGTLGPLKLEPEKPRTGLVVVTPAVTPASRVWVPLERMGRVVDMLDGSQGRNRATSFCFIQARNDLEAVQAYLYKFRGQDKTERAYRKELERFLLWCVLERQVPLSSIGTDECEAYKDFLAQPDEAWIGRKAPRTSDRWKPFAGPLSAESQKYALLVIRAFFQWLVGVRYLGGDPWLTVKDPRVVKKELHIAIDKALPVDLWVALAQEDGILDRVCARFPPRPVHKDEEGKGIKELSGLALRAGDAWAPAVQFRLARAAILLMGYSGLRREETANATRNCLKPVREQAHKANPLWELTVIGKGSKKRTVLFPGRVVDALRAHWADRGQDFEYELAELALISPVVVPGNKTGREKHVDANGKLTGNGFSPDGLYKVLTATLLRIANDASLPLSAQERALLRLAAPHALRHTFANDKVSRDMPLDVLQRLMGHASLGTTSIYVQAERKRSIEEMSKIYGA